MAVPHLEVEDVKPLVSDTKITDAKIAIMIDDITARAVGLVPELDTDMTHSQEALARAVLRKAVVRWIESGSGGVSTKSQSAGPYSVQETYEARGDRPLFYDSEIAELKGIFPHVYGRRKAFSVDLAVRRRTYPQGWWSEWSV